LGLQDKPRQWAVFPAPPTPLLPPPQYRGGLLRDRRGVPQALPASVIRGGGGPRTVQRGRAALLHAEPRRRCRGRRPAPRLLQRPPGQPGGIAFLHGGRLPCDERVAVRRTAIVKEGP